LTTESTGALLGLPINPTNEQLPTGMGDGFDGALGATAAEISDEAQEEKKEDSLDNNEGAETNGTLDATATETSNEVQEKMMIEDSVDNDGTEILEVIVASKTALPCNEEGKTREMSTREFIQGVNAPCCCVIS